MVRTAVTLPRRRLSDWVDAYESALAENEHCHLADFLPPRDDEAYLDVLVEFVRIDVERGWRTGRFPSIDAYLERFPEIRASSDALSAVAFEEYRQRLMNGETVAPRDYSMRYGIDVSQWPAAGDERGSLSHSLSFRGSACESSDGDLAAAGRTTGGRNAWPRVGETVAGFELLGELGCGAFARVFFARQVELANRPVVLKVSDRFPGESQAIAQLQHTNIVPIFSQHRVGELHALCMPYFGCTTFADVLRELKTSDRAPSAGEAIVDTIGDLGSVTQESALRPTVAVQSDRPVSHALGRDAEHVRVSASRRLLDSYSDVEAILWLFSRLAEGLEHAHARGVLHLDLKPANILLRDDGEPMLLDFNLSGQRLSKAEQGITVIGGTLPYMSPEHIRALRGECVAVSPSADVFSLGAVLYEMLTGTRPFAASNGNADIDLEVALAAIAAGPAPMTLVRRDVPPAVHAIVAKCLASDPADRYASAGELTEDLRRQIAQLPLRHAENPSWTELCGKWRRRHPRATSATAIAGIAVAVVAVVSTFWWSAERRIAKVRAQETLAAFIEDSLDAQFLLAATDPSSDDRRRGRELALSSLAAYEVDIGNANGHVLGSNAALLDDTDRDRLRGELTDLQAAIAADDLRSGARCATSEPVDDADASRPASNSTQAIYRQACIEYSAGRFAAAVELLSDANARQPQQVRYWMLRGRAEEARLRHAESIACYTACIVLKPQWAPAYVHRGAARFRQGQFRNAIADFDSALELDGESSAALVNRALARQKLGEAEEAIRDLDRAIALEPERTRFYFLRARMHRRAGNAALAARDEQRAMSRDPQDAEGWVARGVHLVASRPHEALAAFEAALRRDPRSLEALRNRAHVDAEHLRQPRRAIEALSRAIELYPDCAPAVLGRGVLYAREGEREAALADARLGSKLDAGAEAKYQAACIYAQTSRSEASDADVAIDHLVAALHLGFDRKAARRDPDLAPIRSRREFARFVGAPPPAVPEK